MASTVHVTGSKLEVAAKSQGYEEYQMQRHVAHRTDWLRKLREVLVGSKDRIMASQYLNSVAH